MMAAFADGSATMYCHVPVTGSKTLWTVGSWVDAELMLFERA